jgi:hypothetical protein
MKATIAALGAVLALAVLTPLAPAQMCYAPIPQAPDARGPGFYYMNACCQWYGPNYCVRPPYPPFNGMLLPLCPRGNGGNGNGNGMLPQFPGQPWVRSPRDFFMVD